MKIVQLTTFLYMFANICSAAEQLTAVSLSNNSPSSMELTSPYEQPSNTLGLGMEKPSIGYLEANEDFNIKKGCYNEGFFVFLQQKGSSNLLSIVVDDNKEEGNIMEVRLKNKTPALANLPQQIGQSVDNNTYRSKPGQLHRFVNFFVRKMIASEYDMFFLLEKIKKENPISEYILECISNQADINKLPTIKQSKTNRYIKRCCVLLNEESPIIRERNPITSLSILIDARKKEREIITEAHVVYKIPTISESNLVQEMPSYGANYVYRSKPGQAYKFFQLFFKEKLISEENIVFLIKKLRELKIIKESSDAGIIDYKPISKQELPVQENVVAKDTPSQESSNIETKVEMTKVEDEKKLDKEMEEWKDIEMADTEMGDWEDIESSHEKVNDLEEEFYFIG